MSGNADQVRGKRAIVDRQELFEAAKALVKDRPAHSIEVRRDLMALLKGALTEGGEEVRRRLEGGASGNQVVRANSFLVDQVIRVLYDFTVEVLYRNTNPTSGERLSLVAVGGYGRGELAPFSDVDLLFLLPYKQTPWSEQVIEFLLYMLWDLGLKVGNATRSVDECIRLSRGDLTIRTALLEARFLWGDQSMFLELKERFQKEVLAGTGAEYVEAKLAERDERHQRVGDTRYVLEPNIKEGKGGLRDLQTLYWIGKYLYQVDDVKQLIEKGVLTSQEYRLFSKAENFLRTVRCHLHYLAGRAEDRLTFDRQPELAERLGYTDRAGSSGVERFMKHYYLVAKDVGDLTRIFCAAIEEQHRRPRGLKLPKLGLFRREVDGFRVDGDRINFISAEDLKQAPVKIIKLFHVAHERNLDIHPDALRLITRNLSLIDNDLRKDPEANRLFLEVLSSNKDPEVILRRMNESGVFGRFIPDFGRVVAQMQHDMYHVYTVDEHTIRAIGVLAKVESGVFAEDHPLSAEIIKKVKLRRVLYVAVLMHDIAKGRGGDHSVLGEEVARELCPRLGLDKSETDTVAWLVRWHLAMSGTAFKRDLDDPKTISDFVELVQSPERLRLLLVLTVADIRAVGPNVWNGWKGQLLRDLYYRAEEAMLGAGEGGGKERQVAEAQDALRARLNDWTVEEIEAHFERGTAAFWLAADPETHERWARMMRKGDQDKTPIEIDARVHDFQSVTEVTIYTADHPGLFSRLAGAFSVSGANIVDARIFTSSDGMALDVFWIQDLQGAPIADTARINRVKKRIEQTLRGDIRLSKELPGKADQMPTRARQVFTVEPVVIIDNEASNTHTVIEVNGRDRPALLHDVTRALFELSLSISHARISTYGERAVDVFYVKDMFGLKISNEGRLEKIRARLLEALEDPAESHEPSGGVQAAE
jgi:[protein-PII] uridylyltransferase